jgi:hypothetical protein
MTQGSLLHYVGDLDRAQARLERALAIVRKVNGDGHAMVPGLEANIAGIHAERGDHAQQLVMSQRAEEHMIAIYGPDHPLSAQAGIVRRAGLLAVGRPAEALDRLAHARTVLEARLGPRHPLVGEVIWSRGRAQLDSNQPAEAAASFEGRAGAGRRGERPAPSRSPRSASTLLARSGRPAATRARARKLAEQARADQTDAGKRAEVEAWAGGAA